jgi:hypothetical protein
MYSKELPFVTCLPHDRLEGRNIIAARGGKGRPSGTEAILELKKIKALTFNGMGFSEHPNGGTEKNSCFYRLGP